MTVHFPHEFPAAGQWEIYPLTTEGDDPTDLLNASPETLVAFDCPCNTATEDTEGWADMPYDIHIEAADSVYACSRCGRLFKLQLAYRIITYTPLAIKYPRVEEQA